MRTRGAQKSTMRRYLKNNTYIANGKLFFQSKRAFRLLATPLGISQPEGFYDFEKVFVYVTTGGWLGSLFRQKRNISKVVVLKTFGRFGNQTLQLANALTIAKAISADSVACPGNSVLPGFRGELPVGIALDTSKQAVTRTGVMSLVRGILLSWTPEAHLVGNFFYTTALRGGIVTPESRTEAYALIKAARPIETPVTPLAPDHLVIHLRGGDAFGSNAHNEYGQPPVAFYELVMQDQSWSQITIVSEDDVNPALPHILALAKQVGITYSRQSGSLQDDMEFLLSATTLVSSRSTFIPAVAAFSDNVQTVYVFGSEDRFRTDITLRRVVDSAGEYWDSTCVYNWRDEPWQRELMVNYPVDNLRLVQGLRAREQLNSDPRIPGHSGRVKKRKKS